jgi:hypothetical protein
LDFRFYGFFITEYMVNFLAVFYDTASGQNRSGPAAPAAPTSFNAAAQKKARQAPGKRKVKPEPYCKAYGRAMVCGGKFVGQEVDTKEMCKFLTGAYGGNATVAAGAAAGRAAARAYQIRRAVIGAQIGGEAGAAGGPSEALLLEELCPILQANI